MKKRFLLAIATSLAFLIFSCYPGGPEYINDLDTAISVYDSDYNWASISEKTYAIPDDIRHIKDGEDIDSPDETNDAKIISKINEELQSIGLTLVDATDTASIDVVVTITIIEQNNTGSTWYPGGGWWGGWYPGWGPGWGWGDYYPWYPVYYSYKTGTVLIQKGDFKNREVVNGKEIVPPIYEGAIDGLLQGNTLQIGQRIENGIDDLYNQAPF